jgi:Domain of unknown function (DUF1707)
MAGQPLRASDSERDAAVKVLNEALTAGRLSIDEHGDRVEAALGATTVEELEDLTADVQEAPPVRPRSRRSWATLVVPLVAVIAIIALVSAIHRTPAKTTPVGPHGASTAARSRSSAGAQQSASDCTSSSGSTVMSYTGPENTRVMTPRFAVSSSGGCLHYTESSNCISGSMLLYIYQIGVSSVPEPSLFGCNSLTYRLTAGTYYVVVLASGDWKISATSA